MNKTIYKILIFLFTFIFIAMITCTIAANEVDKQTTDTTTEFIATVRYVKINNSMQQAEIYTDEFDAFLFIAPNIGEHINLHDVENLKSGQKICFRIENMYISDMHEAIFLAITELKTDTQDIFTLEKYNEYMYSSANPARITGIVVALISLMTIVICWIKMKKLKSTNGTENGSV